MRARLHDPRGPRWTRLVMPLLGVVCMVLDTHWAMSDDRSLGLGFFMGLATAILAGPILGRHASRNVDLVLGAGQIEVRGAGILNQTLRAKEILGASTSAAEGKITLALHRTGRAEVPILLEVADERAANTVREALGIGHFGFGSLSWPVIARGRDRYDLAARIVAAASAVTLGIMGFLEPGSSPFDSHWLLFSLLSSLAVVGLLLLRGEDRLTARLSLSPDGVDVGREDGWTHVPFAQIRAVTELPDGLLIERYPPETPVFLPLRVVKHARRGVSVTERGHILEQLGAAARRARGEAPPPPDLSHCATLLLRSDSPDARSWLQRLDATAQTLGQGAHYRGGALTEADLWAALENPDADANLRAAAARVLARVAPDSAPARIDAVLAAVRDEEAEKRIRIALEPDVDLASQGLEELDRRRLPSPR